MGSTTPSALPRRSTHCTPAREATRRGWKLEGADFLGWKAQSFDTDAGPLDVVPLAAAIGGFEDVATIELALGELSVRVLAIDEVIASKEKLGRPKDTAALPALYATREALRRRRGESVE